MPTTLKAPASQPVPKTPADFPLYAPGLPIIGPTMGVIRDPIDYHLAAYRQHGPIYRTSYLGSESLVIGGLDANEFVWSNSALWSYHDMRASFREEFGDKYLTPLDGDPHRRKRRRLNPAFRPDLLMGNAPAMSRVVRERLERLKGEKVELRLTCHRLLLNMTSQVLLGIDLDEEQLGDIILVEKDLLLGGLFGPARRLFFNRPKYLRAKRKVIEYLGRLVDERLAKPLRDDDRDTFSVALRSVPDGETPDRDELIGDLYLLLTGGLNSTANLALWTLMYLSFRPDWLAQIREEIAAVPPDRFTAMKQWPKIKATVMEIERMRPPTPINVLLPVEDFEFQNIRVKKGTPVTHVLCLTHFMSEIYDQPFEFRPERFLGETNYPAKAHAAFGGGAHMCIGMPLARLQVPLIIANIAANFDLEFTRPLSFQPRLSAALTPAQKSIPARFRPHAAPSTAS